MITPKLDIIPEVTMMHGGVFAEVLIRRLKGGEAVQDAFDWVRVLAYPSEGSDPESFPRWGAITADIVNQTLDAARERLAEAFVGAAETCSRGSGGYRGHESPALPLSLRLPPLVSP
jgi:hypothetical protein